MQTDWQTLKRNAFQKACTMPTEGVVVASSFTDLQPLHGWEPTHAVRELWQNFRDGLAARFGNQVKLTRTQPARFEAVLETPTGPRIVGFLDGSTVNRLVLVQAECLLDLEHLQMASWKGNDSIGGHGEGFKVGINLLLRNNYQVAYYFPYYQWKFGLVNFYSSNFRNMCVQQLRDVDRDEMVIVIEGQDAHMLFDPKIDLNLSTGITFACSGAAGDLLFVNQEWYGRVYCRGLFVAVDADLRKLCLAVNLNIQVARDRHLIPNNTWNLIENILNEAKQKFIQDRQRYGQITNVFQHLLRVCSQYKPSDHSLMRALAHVKPALTNFVAAFNKVTTESVVFVAASQSTLEELLRQLGHHIVSGAGALADAVDPEQIRLDFIRKQPETQAVGEEQRTAKICLENLLAAISISANETVSLVIKDLPEALVEFTPEYIRAERHVVVHRDMLSVSQLSLAAQTIAFKLQRRMQGGSKLAKAFAHMMVDFVRNPVSFVPRDYDMRGSPTQLVSAPTLLPTASSSLAHASIDMHEEPLLESSANTSNQPLGHRLRPDNRIRSCDFRGVPEVIKTSTDLPEDEQHCYRSYSGQLFPKIFNNITVYFDRDFDRQFAQNSVFTTSLSDNLPAIKILIDLISKRVSTKLQIPSQNLPILFVAVRSDLYGFTQNGGIYINIVPLLKPTTRQDLAASFFLTLLHEITHRVQTSHNTHFADELARLVFNCRDCLDYI